jgi:hypothetical protein
MGHRAVFNADTAPSTAVHVDAPGPCFDLDPEISGSPLHGFQIRIGDQLDIPMPADLDQFGRDNSHGTIICGKGFIQLGHGPSDRGALFQKVYVKSAVGQVQGRLHAGNTPAHHQHGSLFWLRHDLCLLVRFEHGCLIRFLRDAHEIRSCFRVS